MDLKFNEAKTVRPNHLERCLCYDKFLKGYRCYVYDDISKYWCTQATTEHDPNGDNHIVDYADYQVTKWASLQQEQPEFVKEIWHKVSEEANLTRPVVLSDGDKYMSPPCTFPFKDMSGFVKAMNKKYKADYTIWAYMDDLLNIPSLQQEQPMPNSTKLIELWHEDKEMLKEKDFRDDPWRLAYNAFMCGFGRGIAVNKQEQPNNMIQWTGNNLKEVIDFTGKSPRFDEWFKSWEEFESYVHSHGDILKLFSDDGSHYEVPVGAWIIKTPDGYNVPSAARFIPAKQEQPEVELEKEEFVGVAESPLKTFPRVNDFECGSSYRH